MCWCVAKTYIVLLAHSHPHFLSHPRHHQQTRRNSSSNIKVNKDDSYSYSYFEKEPDEQPMADKALNTVLDAIESVVFFPVNVGVKMCASQECNDGRVCAEASK